MLARVGVVNVNSLINKVNFIYNLLSVKNFLILGICETWLVEEVSSSFVEIPRYKFFRRDVGGRVRKHGVGLYLREELDAVQVDVNVPNVLVVHLVEWGLYVVVVYRPPSYDNQANDVLKQFILDFCFDKGVIVLGDFNLSSLRWSEQGDLLEGYVRPLDQEFYEVFLEVGLRQIVCQPTFALSGNTLDLVLVSNAESVGNVEVLPPLPQCHHAPVLVDLCMDEVLDCAEEKYIRLWHKGNYAAICSELESLDWSLMFEGQMVDDCFSIFVDVSADLINQYVPEVEYSDQSPRWVRPPRSLLRRRSVA